MSTIYQCRRTIVSLFGIVCLTAIACYKGQDVAMAIASICGALSAANAYEKKGAAGGPEAK